MTIYRAWTDGACVPNPGIGGWGAVLIGETMQKLSGGTPATTNNRMEFWAVFEAVRNTPEGCRLDVFTDSKNTARALSGLGKPKMNLDLIAQIMASVAMRNLDATFTWIKRDSHPLNVMADALADQGRRSVRIETTAPYGGCPLCGHADAILDIKTEHWGSCSRHLIKWFVGENVFPEAAGQPVYEANRNREHLRQFRQMEAIYPNQAEAAE